MRSILAVMWSAAAIAFIFMVCKTEIPSANVRIVDTIIGFVLGTIVAGIIGYYFGSSQSSADKNEIIKDANAAKP